MCLVQPAAAFLSLDASSLYLLDTFTDWMAVQRPEAAIMAGPIEQAEPPTEV